MRHAQAIAVIGVGCRFPGSQDPQSLWENVLARRAQFRRFLDCRLPVQDYVHPDDPDQVYAHRAAYVDGFAFDWQAHRIPRSTFEHTDVVQWLALDVALQALAHADLDLTDAVRERTGVIVGNSLTGEQSRASTLRLRWPFVRKALRASLLEHGVTGDAAVSLEKATRERFLSVFPSVDEDSLQGGLSNTIAGRICNYLDLKGGGYVVDGACSSSLLAVATGAERLMSGALDVAIVGGVDVSLDPMELVGFSRAGALTPDKMRVYDAAGNGFIPGEGAGFVVLKRLADARRDGDDVVAVLRGWGVSSDGKGAITAPSGAGQARAITRAYECAGLTPNDVDFVEGHGTGTKAGDLAELMGLQLAFESLGGNPEHQWGMTSLKSLVGHMKAAAGMGGFVKAVLSVNQRVVPPTAGITRPHPAFSEKCQNLYPLLNGKVHEPDAVLRAGVSAMGFGGINTHVLVESADPPDPALQARTEPALLLASAQQTELLCLSADNPDQLRQQLQELQETVQPLAVGELAGLARQTNQRWRPASPLRVAFVVTDPDDLLQACASVVAALPALGDTPMGAPDGRWWLGRGLADPVIGFVYPGQGSQYIGTASVPLARFAWARQMRSTLVALAAEYGSENAPGWTASPDQTRERQRLTADLMQTEVAQPALCLSSAIYTQLLQQLGVQPAIVGGHSLGELSALWAAGATDLNTLFDWSLARGQAMATHAPPGAMASLRCGPDRANLLVSGLIGVEVCNHNTPDHTVIGGNASGIDTAIERAQNQGIQARKLRVSRAFHTGQMEAAADALADGPFAGCVVPALRCVLVSSVNGRAMEPGTDLLAHAQHQLRAPVDFTALTRRISAVCDVVLEVGPGRVLSGLVNHTVGTELCMPMETAGDQGDSLNRALARLSIWGVPLALDTLYEGRAVPEPVPFDTRTFIDNPCERPMHSTHVPVPVEAASNPQALSTEVLKDYLASRGDFLVDVLTADLRSAGRPQRPRVEPKRLPVAPLPVTPTPAPPEQTVPRTEGSIQERLIGLLADKTGFSSDAISADARLLDELNLDSIKAGEVLYAAADAAGVADQLDLTEFTNATVAEIAAKITSAAGGNRPETGVKVPAFDQANQWIRRFQLTGNWRPSPLGKPETSGDLLVLHAEPDPTPLRQHAETVTPCRWRHWDAPSTATAHVAVLLPVFEDPEAAVAPLHGMLTAALKCAQDTLLVVIRGAPLGLEVDGVRPSTVGVSALLASIHAERPQLAITVLHLLAEPTGPTWFGPAVRAGMNAQGFATLAVFPDDPTRMLAPEVCALGNLQDDPNLGAPDDLWLVTGGARGVTLACALALAERGVRRFVLVGRTPAPDDPEHAINQAIAGFSAVGADAKYVSCDLTDADQVTTVLTTLQDQLGPIHHVVHGAGVNHVARFELTSQASAVRETRVKVGGLRNLLAQLDLEPLKSLVGLSSVIGVFGMPGNAWYAFANEALDHQVAAIGRKHPHIHARTLAFTLWGETGMVERLNTVGRLKQMGVVPLATHLGTGHFLAAYGAGGPSRVVVTGSLGDLTGWQSLLPTAFDSEAFGGQVVHALPGVEAVVRIELSNASDVYLEDHDFEGSRLFPTVMGLQAMTDTAALILNGTVDPVSFEDVALSRPITVTAETVTTLFVHALVPADDLDCVDVAVYVDRTSYREPHFRARIRPGAPGVENGPSTLATTTALPISSKVDLYGDLLFQGPRFQRMGALLQLDADHLVVRALSPTQSEHIRSGVTAPSLGSPYLRDLLLQAPAVPLAPDQLLPVSIAHLHRYGPAPADAIVHAQITARRGDEIEAEVKLCDAQGRVFEHLVGYRARVVRRRPGRPTAADLLSPSRFNRDALNHTANEAMSAWQLPVPSLHLDDDPLLADPETGVRHLAQRVLVSGLANTLAPDAPQHSLTWSDVGKPALQDAETHGQSPLQVSMSHNDQGLFLAALHTGPVGCDLERIAERTFAEWQFLLGPHNAILFNRIFSVGGTMAEAGHHVWAAMEVAVKLGVPDDARVLELLGFRDGVTAFWVRDTHFTVVTFPFKPLGAAPVLVGIGVERPLQTAPVRPAAPVQNGVSHETR